MNNIPEVHIIDVKYIPATNTRGSRIKLSSHFFNHAITIPYESKGGNACEQAINLLINSAFTIIGKSATKAGYVIIAQSFRPLK